MLSQKKTLFIFFFFFSIQIKVNVFFCWTYSCLKKKSILWWWNYRIKSDNYMLLFGGKKILICELILLKKTVNEWCVFVLFSLDFFSLNHFGEEIEKFSRQFRHILMIYMFNSNTFRSLRALIYVNEKRRNVKKV